MDEKTVAPPNLDLAHDRTGLAKFRTQLALDRTTLAWIRTALTMATFGFGTVGFFRTLRERSQAMAKPPHKNLADQVAPEARLVAQIRNSPASMPR
jgi:uncharacterized membrane protein YidH (DUF202 family)